MKYSANQRRISIFVVGRTGSEYGPPVAVIKKLAVQGLQHFGEESNEKEKLYNQNNESK